MHALVTLYVLTTAAAACGGGGTPTQPVTPTGATIQVTASPAPVSLTLCDPPACTTPGYEVITTLTLRETAGIAGRVDSITLTLRRNSDNQVLVTANITPASIQVPFTANGTATIPFAMHVARTDVTSQTTLALVVNATDSGGRAVTTSLTVPVNGPSTGNGLFITGNYQIVQATLATSCGDTGTPATVTGWVTLTGPNTFRLADTGGTTFNGTVQANGQFTANAVFAGGGQTFTQALTGAFTSGAGFTGTLSVTVAPSGCAFTRAWTGTRLASLGAAR